MLKRKLFTALVIAASTMFGQAALAHGGAKPQHGGVVQVANDIGFELVAEADGATLYLQDHGMPMASAVSNGMDAPTRRRHRSATVDVSATTRSGRSVHHGDYDHRP